ncbi:hypothetical protein PVMG_05640 [Plasmodium vivax Mauritania I]|uniref:Variable surface protein Vir7-like protein n=1 Tax=Plasmodium vivax Mauritania I TaxID=1035515 RepID=A0A0J9TIS5_PLAVI|nr:hypothetical protein PVMG_05640 [Plasmodium vivax Mauritania I]
MHELKDYLSVRDISDKITKALCYVYMKKPYYTKLESDLCSYMYYWIGDKIYANTGNNGEFTRIMRMLYDVLNLTDKNIICKHFNYEIDRDTFYKNKLLFDYSQDHENIKIHTAGYKTCSQDYKKHMENYISTYTDAYSYCYLKKGNKYDCETFFSLFPNDKYNELSAFRCVLSENPKEVLEQPSVFRTQEHEHTHNYVRTTRLQDSFGHHSTPDDSSLGSKPSSEIHQNLQKISPVLIEDTAESASSKSIAGSIAPVLGVSSFSLLLYKVIENIIDIHQIIGYI